MIEITFAAHLEILSLLLPPSLISKVTVMSHRLDSLSPMFSSPLTRCRPMQRSTSSAVARNLQTLFDQTSSSAVVKRTSHPDLKRISSPTLVSLLQQRSDDLLIIDARYPFEYAGGHISSAKNVYTEADLRALFAKLLVGSSSRPSLIIFHCEFSSERGPRLCRLFRSLDRQHNVANYPHLSFPAVYLLDGGYADFYHHALGPRWCEPKSYVSMFEKQFTQELKIYRHAKKVAHGRMIGEQLLERQAPIRFCLS